MELPLYHFPPVLQQPALIIPANTVKEFTQRTTSGNSDISVVGIFPHMHLIGKSYTIFSTKNTDTTKLISIPDWDFHWQGFYTFQKLVKIPRQSILQGRAVYNNTTSNPHNPSNPPITVSAGENTKDEMMVAFIAYTTYQPGDENIILDSTLINTGIQDLKKEAINVYPNPVNDMLYITLNEDIQSIKIISLDGRIQLTESVKNAIDVSALADGIYFVEVSTLGNSYRKKIVKTK